MITVLFGLVVIACAGTLLAAYIKSTPGSAKTLKAKSQRARQARRGENVPLQMAKAVGVAWRKIRPTQADRQAKLKAAHEGAKKAGATAATSPVTTVNDRRGWRGAVDDLKEAWRRSGQHDDDEAGDELPASTEERDVPPPPDQAPARTPPGPQTNQPTPTDERRPSMPTYTTLFEAGDQMTALPFEHVFQIEQFIKALHQGTVNTSNMYLSLAARMNGPMSIDNLVTEPVETCGSHQRAIYGAVGDADVNLSVVLSGTVDELLERGIKVPPPELMNNTSGGMGHLLVPAFFETCSTLAGRAFGDIRDVHCLLKALREASESQRLMYARIASRLSDLRIDTSIAERFTVAARHQTAISMSLADADTNMGRLLNMTVRELAASGVKSPNAHMVGV